MNINRYFAIALGGTLGAGLRWLITTWSWPSSEFPWAIFTVNVIGCAMLGLLMAEEWGHPQLRLWLRDFGGIGFCGGLTTMSTFAFDVVKLHDQYGIAFSALYIFSSVAIGIAVFVLSAALLRRVRALQMPLEQEP